MFVIIEDFSAEEGLGMGGQFCQFSRYYVHMKARKSSKTNIRSIFSCLDQYGSRMEVSNELLST